MARTLPTPIRVAAGVVGTTLDTITTLPEKLPALGVSLVGQAFRTSLRVRQELAALTARGDQLLGGFARHEDKPAWATFDEDDDDDPMPSPLTPEPEPEPETRTTRTARPRRPVEADPETRPTSPGGAASRRRPSRVRTTEPLGDVEEAIGIDAAVAVEADLLDGLDSPPRGGIPAATAGPTGWPGYLVLSVAEVKERVADAPIAEIRRLLDFEETGPARPAFLTMLANRLATLQAR